MHVQGLEFSVTVIIPDDISMSPGWNLGFNKAISSPCMCDLTPLCAHALSHYHQSMSINSPLRAQMWSCFEILHKGTELYLDPVFQCM